MYLISIFFILFLRQVIKHVSEQVNKYENETSRLFKNTYCVTEILIKEGNYFSFPFIFVFLYILIIMF